VAARCSVSATGSRILLEAGLLPGAMLRNDSLQFRCQQVHLRVEQTDTPFTLACSPGRILTMPIAHGEGNYYVEPDVIARLEANRQVIFRYVTPQGDVTSDANPNGSINNIAGICNQARNVVGLMPHPDRACELAIGSADGLVMFESVVKAVSEGAFATVR
jgi:phosphoribosylformylglycinamidine synthase